MNNRNLIEKALGTQPEWNPNPEKKDKVILLTREIDTDDKDQWHYSVEWLVENTVKFRDVFGGLIRSRRE